MSSSSCAHDPISTNRSAAQHQAADVCCWESCQQMMFCIRQEDVEKRQENVGKDRFDLQLSFLRKDSGGTLRQKKTLLSLVWAPIKINQHQSAPININQNQSSSISINQHQSALISTNQHQSASISIDQHQSAQHQSASISTNQHQSASISINQH